MTHTHVQESSGGMGFLLGVIALIMLFLFFIYYALPLMRNATSSPSIQVPEKVDVNINK